MFRLLEKFWVINTVNTKYSNRIDLHTRKSAIIHHLSYVMSNIIVLYCQSYTHFAIQEITIHIQRQYSAYLRLMLLAQSLTFSRKLSLY
jgi:hypothetical protein